MNFFDDKLFCDSCLAAADDYDDTPKDGVDLMTICEEEALPNHHCDEPSDCDCRCKEATK